MRILFDHCVPRAAFREFADLPSDHASRLGWDHLSNGALLSAAEKAGFTVLVTIDQGIPAQQSFKGRQISVLIIRANPMNIAAIRRGVKEIYAALGSLSPGEVKSLTIEPAPRP